jgi:predicted transposase YdaD
VVIYPDRQTERINNLHFNEFLQLPNVTRIYINKLTPTETTSLPVQLLKLITAPEATAPDLAIELARQAQAEIPDISENLINLLETIILYKLPQKSREEIAAMFSLSDLKQTRVYQEIFKKVQAEAKQRERLAIFRMLDLGLTTEKLLQF